MKIANLTLECPVCKSNMEVDLNSLKNFQHLTLADIENSSCFSCSTEKENDVLLKQATKIASGFS